MIKKIFTNSFGILFSRILGFIRDLLTAQILGANIYSDIFFIAFKLPNLFRRIFAEGAFTQAFLPSFAASRHKTSFAYTIFVRFFITLFLFSLLVTLFAPFFTKAMAIGFDAQTIEIAAPLVAINFYYLIFIYVVTFFASLLQYKNHFATTAFSTALLNIGIIVALVLGGELPPSQIVYYMSYGVIAGGLLQVAVHLYVAKRLGVCKWLIVGAKKDADETKEDRKKFTRSFIPAILGNSTAQISAFIDTWLASFLITGSISYMYYANRVFQLPLALFAIATSTAIFPKIARYINNQNAQQAQTLLHKSFWFLAYLLSISTLGGIILSQEIVWLLFERGAFSHENTLNTAGILTIYMIGLLPYGLAKIFSLWLYAHHQQTKAAKISVIALVIGVIASLLLISPYGAVGLAMANTLSGFILFILTAREYEHFFAILKNKLAFYLIVILGLETVILLYLKEIIDAYIR